MLHALLLVREATQSHGALSLALAPMLRRLEPKCVVSSSAATVHTSSVAGGAVANSSGDSPDVFTPSLAAKAEEELRQMVMNQGQTVSGAAEADTGASAAASGDQQGVAAGGSEVR